MGMLGATLAALLLPPLPVIVGAPLCLLAGLLAGLIWAAGPALWPGFCVVLATRGRGSGTIGPRWLAGLRVNEKKRLRAPASPAGRAGSAKLGALGDWASTGAIGHAVSAISKASPMRVMASPASGPSVRLRP